jgi:hypothetical protein
MISSCYGNGENEIAGSKLLTAQQFTLKGTVDTS